MTLAMYYDLSGLLESGKVFPAWLGVANDRSGFRLTAGGSPRSIEPAVRPKALCRGGVFFSHEIARPPGVEWEADLTPQKSQLQGG